MYHNEPTQHRQLVQPYVVVHSGVVGADLSYYWQQTTLPWQNRTATRRLREWRRQHGDAHPGHFGVGGARAPATFPDMTPFTVLKAFQAQNANTGLPLHVDVGVRGAEVYRCRARRDKACYAKVAFARQGDSPLSQNSRNKVFQCT